MKTKKLWSAILAFALVVSSTASGAWNGSVAKAAETKAKVLAYVAVENDAATGSAIKIDKTPVLLDEGSTALDALQQVLDTNGYKDKYEVKQESYGDTIDEIDGMGTVAIDPATYTYVYWSFGVNGEAASVVAGNYTLQNNDQISYVYTSDYTNVECDSFKDDNSNDPNEEQAEALVNTAKEKEQALAGTIYKTQFENGKVVPGLDDINSLYTVFSLARANYGTDDADVQAFYDAVYTKIEKQFAAIKAGEKVYDTQGKEISFEEILSGLTGGYAATFYAKAALCVEALGKDPKDVGGVDLIEKLTDRSVYEGSNSYITVRAPMVLFALDAIDAEIPEGDAYITREEIVKELLDQVDAQIAQSIEWKSWDSAAMTIQALAPYVGTGIGEVSGDDVDTAVEKVLGLLATMQESDGKFGTDSWNPNGNVWTLAQIMITMGCFDIAPITQDEDTVYDFIKNGKTVFDAAASFVDEKTGTVDAGLMGYQPEQLLRGLTACIRTENSESGLFDLVDDTVYTAQESTKTELTADMISPIADQTYTGEACTPDVVITANGKTLVKDTDYRVTYFENIEAGDKTAYAVVQGIGDYYMNQKVSFSIVKKEEPTNPPVVTTAPTNAPVPTAPASSTPAPTKKPSTQTKKTTLSKPVIKKVKAGKKTLTVQFAKVKNAKKYVVEVSTNKKFKKNVSKKTVKKGTKAVFKKLKSKKTYYVRVYAVNGKNKSAYSKVKSKKVK